MESTMMDFQLTVSAIMRYGTTVFGDKEVVTCAGDEPSRRRTYAAVGERTARLANALRSLGVDGDQRVGTFMWNNAEHLEAYLAIPAMGAVLHTLNIRLSADQVGYIATHAGDHAVIVDSSLVPLFAKVLPYADTIRHVIVSGPADDEALASLAGHGREVHSYEELLAAASDSFDWPEIDERSAAAMCYTSGTTGLPKGVAYSHRSTYLHSMAVCTVNGIGVSEHDRVMPIVPHVPRQRLGPGLRRDDVRGRPGDAGPVHDPRRHREADRDREGDGGRRGADHLAGRARPPADGRRRPVVAADAGLRRLGAAGGGDARVRRRVRDRHDARVGDDRALADRIGRPRARGRHRGGGLALPGVPGAAGLRRGGAADRRDGEVLPSDGKAVGELETRGPWITASYYKDHAPEKFDDGWLRTGDVGTLDEAGFIRLTDRAKDVIKSGGEWISSMELENILMAHPSVAEAAVVGVPDERWGERPLAAVVLRSDAPPATPDELRAFLGERIPRWQLPERWAYIDEVPKTSVGKFKKTTLRDRYADGDLEVTTLAPLPH